jgi:hypothetical protein
MLENWIVAGASTLAGVNDLPNNLPARDKIEDRSGVVWIETQLRSRDKTRKYRKTVDAEHFIRIMDLQECRTNSPSFDKLCRELEARLPQKPDESEPKSPQNPSDPPATTDTSPSP